MKAAFTKGYKGGEFFTAIIDATGIGWNRHYDPNLTMRGKATLDSMVIFQRAPGPVEGRLGVMRVNAPGADPSKATLGTSGATGGYVLPITW